MTSSQNEKNMALPVTRIPISGYLKVSIIVEQHPAGKFGLLIDVLSVSSSAVAGNVEVPETFRA